MCAAATPPSSSKGSSPFVSTNAKGEQLGQTREVGNQATWSLSSCKPGTSKFIYFGYFIQSVLL